jgi:hypothetical protein
MQQAQAFSREDRLKIAIILAILVIDFAWIALRGFAFDWSGTLKLALVLPLLLGVAEVYRRWRPNPRFSIMTRETAWLLAFSAAAAVLSNLVVTADLPLIDGRLAAIDRLFGFDWPAYYAFMTSAPYGGLAASVLYVSALPMVAFAVIGLSFMGRPDRAQEMVLAAMIGAILAIVISGLLPSSGALAYFRPDEAALAHRPIVDLAYKQTFFDLRDGAATVFSLDGIKGLIAFPSYHATLSVLGVLAFRGMARFFWPLFVLNAGVLLTTPVEGGHHLIDAIGGTLVAVAALWLAAAWRKRLAGAAAAHSWRNGAASESISASSST